MRPYDVAKAMVGGLLGTLLQTIMVYGVAPLIAGPSMAGAAIMGHACAPSLLVHLLSGSVIFPLGYVWLSSQPSLAHQSCRGCSGQGSDGLSPRSSWRRC
jgi:hypothetical protein